MGRTILKAQIKAKDEGKIIHNISFMTDARIRAAKSSFLAAQFWPKHTMQWLTEWQRLSELTEGSSNKLTSERKFTAERDKLHPMMQTPEDELLTTNRTKILQVFFSQTARKASTWDSPVRFEHRSNIALSELPRTHAWRDSTISRIDYWRTGGRSCLANEQRTAFAAARGANKLTHAWPEQNLPFSPFTFATKTVRLMATSRPKCKIPLKRIMTGWSTCIFTIILWRHWQSIDIKTHSPLILKQWRSQRTTPIGATTCSATRNR